MTFETFIFLLDQAWTLILVYVGIPEGPTEGATAQWPSGSLFATSGFSCVFETRSVANQLGSGFNYQWYGCVWLKG